MTSAATAGCAAPWPAIRPGLVDPDIQVVDVDLGGDRKLILEHRVTAGRLLEEQEARQVLRHLASLWSYDVLLRRSTR